LIRADLHIHTCYSIDCCTSLEELVKHCLEAGINCLAVTDHDTIAGALKLREIAPFKIIIGEEISTSAGDLIGLFLNEEIPPALSPQETIARIKSQGGLADIPHPFGRWPGYNCKKLRAPEIISRVDIIEVSNSATLLPSSRKAWNLALKYNLAPSAGSDAHTLGEIGKAYVEIAEFDSPADFLVSLSQGSIFGRKSGLLAHLTSAWAAWAKARKEHC